MAEKIVLRILRQDHPRAHPRWEVFHIRNRPHLNVITCLMDIQKNPRLADGRETTPVAWEANCLEEVCGACTMVINGRVRQACSALVANLKWPIVIEPMTKFPVIRDLIVDRRSMFASLQRIQGWVPLESLADLGPGPRIPPRIQEIAYELSRCMTCGCCLEACPQVNERSSFIGPAAISQVRYFNLHPTGAQLKSARLRALMGPGGIEDCGNAQNCVRVCPKNIPLTTSIAGVNRQISLELVKLLKRS